jgi:hypothetical protein
MEERTWSVTVEHGDDLGAEDYAALQTVRRTLLGMLGHGVIASFETYAGHDRTTWSYRQGSEDGGGIHAGLLDVLHHIAPRGWRITTAATPPGRPPEAASGPVEAR